MSNVPIVIIATLCAFVVSNMFGTAATQNLADKPAVQDAVVDFGHGDFIRIQLIGRWLGDGIRRNEVPAPKNRTGTLVESCS